MNGVRYEKKKKKFYKNRKNANGSFLKAKAKVSASRTRGNNVAYNVKVNVEHSVEVDLPIIKKP